MDALEKAKDQMGSRIPNCQIAQSYALIALVEQLKKANEIEVAKLSINEMVIEEEDD